MNQTIRNLFTMLALVFVTPAFAATLTIYTDRPTARLQPLADQFQAQTGHQVEIVEAAYSDLAARLKQDGEASAADLLWTKDLIYLNQATPFFKALSPGLTSAVPAFMQNPEQGWTALTHRARTIVYNPDFVNAAELSTYEDLASPTWEKALCVRNAGGTYNLALVSFLIQKHGVEKTREIVAGWMKNLAAEPFKNDTSLIEAISRGECLVGIINTYYLGMAKTQNPSLRAEIFFADQKSGGAHTNGSGIGLLKNSKNGAIAEAFIAFLLTPASQQHLADSHFEYPAVTGVSTNTVVQTWGDFTRAPISWSDLAPYEKQAADLMQELGYR